MNATETKKWKWGDKVFEWSNDKDLFVAAIDVCLSSELTNIGRPRIEAEINFAA